MESTKQPACLTNRPSLGGLQPRAEGEIASAAAGVGACLILSSMPPIANVLLAEYHSVFTAVDGPVREELLSDRMHQSAAGHELMAWEG